MVFDLRSRQVPAVLTLVPLALAAVWRFFLGGWVMVLLVAALILISDISSKRWRIPLASLVTLLLLFVSENAETVYGILAIAAIWGMWELKTTGGADAKIIITLVLLFGNGLLYVPIVLAGGVQGLIGLIARRKSIPFTISITLGTAAWLWIVGAH
jgi:Flp pilus assembly protein protease CpaA